MPTTRVIYQQENVFVGPANSTGFFYSSGNAGTNLIKQLYRVQSANRSFNISNTDINELGVLARLGTLVTEPPSVSFDTSWYVTNVNNESGVGLSVNGPYSSLSGILTKVNDDRNIFVSRSPQGQDDDGFVGAGRICYGLGNCFLTQYGVEASVGGLATASATFEAFNFYGYNSASGVSPAINPVNGTMVSGPTFSLPVGITGLANQALAIRYGEIVLDLSNLSLIGASVSDLKLQSFNLSLPIARESINVLGSLYPSSKDVTVPINGTLSFSAVIGDTQTGNLNSVLCSQDKYNVTISLYKPACPGVTGALAARYTVLGAILNSESFGMTVGPNENLDVELSFQAGGASDVQNGLLISGALDY